MEVVDGLPLHILLVHLEVVLVPLASLLSVASAVWPWARRRLGLVTPIVALAALILTPIVTNAGEWLQDRVANTPLVRTHVELGHTLLPWVAVTFAISLITWVWFRFFDHQNSRMALPQWLTRVVWVGLSVAAVVIAAGTIVDVVLIGEAGARAVWQGSFSTTPLHK